MQIFKISKFGQSIFLMAFGVGIKAQFYNDITQATGQSIPNSLLSSNRLDSVLAKHFYCGTEFSLAGFGELSGKMAFNRIQYNRTKVGISSLSGIGTDFFQIGLVAGAFVSVGFLSIDSGITFYGRYQNFFARLSGGLDFGYFFESCFLNDSGFKFFSLFGSLQFGYYFYEDFYASIIVRYNLEPRIINSYTFEFMSSVLYYKGRKYHGFSIGFTVGVYGSYQESLLESLCAEEEAKELARLKAREKFEKEKKIKDRS